MLIYPLKMVIFHSFLYVYHQPQKLPQISPFAEALLQQLGLARGIPTVAVAQNLLRHHVLAVTGVFNGVLWCLMVFCSDLMVFCSDFMMFYDVLWGFMMFIVILW
jgi:hypothetical protein